MAWMLSAALTGFFVQAENVLPDFVNWTHDGAYQQDNGLRSLICLNGWWRWQVFEDGDQGPPTEGWHYRKVPGYGLRFHVRGQDGEVVKIPKEKEFAVCWVERELTVPEAWQHKKVSLLFGNIYKKGGEIYLDGQRAGYTWAESFYRLDLPKPYRRDRPYRLSMKCVGVIGNIWIAAFQGTTHRVADWYLTTSVRNRSATIRASGTGSVDVKVKLAIAEYKKPGKVVKTAGLFDVEASGKGWRVETNFGWEDAKLWSPGHPSLYQYTLELVDTGGKVVDRTFPIRFGFRELWIEGGDFILNGRRVTITNTVGHLPLSVRPAYYSYRGLGQYASEEEWRKIIRRNKSIGLNCADYRWGSLAYDDTLFRVADEEGYFISFLPQGLKGNPYYLSIPEIRAHAENVVRHRIISHRHSPSVCFYLLPGTHGLPPCWDYQPAKLGEDFDRGTDPNKAERELLEDLDPARISFSYSGGGKGEVAHSSMNYFPLDVDLQGHDPGPGSGPQTAGRIRRFHDRDTCPDHGATDGAGQGGKGRALPAHCLHRRA